MKPIYDRLTSIELLTRCERKGTQNANESLHSVIWSKCPKTSFYSRPRVEFSAILAIAEFNFGPAFCVNLRNMYGTSVSDPAIKLGQVREHKKLNNSARREKFKENNIRNKKREATAKMNAELEEAEGGPMYGPGIASTLPSISKGKAIVKKGVVVKGKKSKKLPSFF